METKPFHESIIDAIKDCNQGSDLALLGSLILKTSIPKNHNEIAGSFNAKTQGAFSMYYPLAFEIEKKLKSEKELTQNS
jgi:hypothetical protein